MLEVMGIICELHVKNLEFLFIITNGVNKTSNEGEKKKSPHILIRSSLREPPAPPEELNRHSQRFYMKIGYISKSISQLARSSRPVDDLMGAFLHTCYPINYT